MENIQYKGKWFLPNFKETWHYGILSFDAEKGASLELFGLFRDGKILYEIDLIHGLTTDSKRITLCKSILLKPSSVTHKGGQKEVGDPTQLYEIGYILDGAYIDKVEDLKFQTLISNINNLDEWVYLNGFEIPNKQIGLHYKQPDEIRFTLVEGTNGFLSFKLERPYDGFGKISWSQKVELKIEAGLEKSIDELLKYLFNFQNFLVLALYRKTYPNYIILESDRYSVDYGDNGIPNLLRDKIYLYFKIRKGNTEKNFHPNNMLFSYSSISDNFSTIIQNWYEKCTTIEPVVNLLIEQFYSDFTTNSFLNLAQAAETFHARLHDYPEIPKDQYDAMRKSIFESTKTEYHAWLKEKFQFGNHLPLHTRLTELMNMYSTETLDKIIGDKSHFIQKTKQSRNYYTHYSLKGERQALKDNDLRDLSNKLKYLLVSAILIELGFSSELVSKLLKDKEFSFAKLMDDFYRKYGRGLFDHS